MHPLFLVPDALRNADAGLLRQIDEQASGNADLGGKPRAFRAERILYDLHHQVLALGEQLLDRLRVGAVLAMAPDVGDVQERGARAADVDERGLHAGQHPHHAPHADVADQPARGGAFDLHFLHHALLDDGDARLLRRDVDQDFFSHASPA